MIRLLKEPFEENKKKSCDKCPVAQRVSMFTKTRAIDSKTRATRQAQGKGK